MSVRVRDDVGGIEPHPARVLIIDPDPSIRREVRAACEQDGYEVVEADSAAAGAREAEDWRPSLILLEVVLPDGSGFDVCREVRRLDAGLPIIMVSSRSDEIDVVVGLEIGADDYVVKPLRVRELMARVAAHLRKVRLENAELSRTRLEFKDLAIDVNERRVYRSGRQVDLTHTEFDLLAFLASNAGKVLSREKILNRVWGYEYPIETRVIDVHIRNLRRKIEEQSSRPFYILAVPGIGYRFTNARTD
ncbi:MAG: response regulator transcription factor [Candidatus Dormibacterales bacterium]